MLGRKIKQIRIIIAHLKLCKFYNLILSARGPSYTSESDVYIVVPRPTAAGTQTDRQTDRQTERGYFTKLHGWDTLAKIKEVNLLDKINNNRCRDCRPKIHTSDIPDCRGWTRGDGCSVHARLDSKGPLSETHNHEKFNLLSSRIAHTCHMTYFE